MCAYLQIHECVVSTVFKCHTALSSLQLSNTFFDSLKHKVCALAAVWLQPKQVSERMRVKQLKLLQEQGDQQTDER